MGVQNLVIGIVGTISACVIGYSAVASTFTLQPGPGEGKDIWTTSLYSFAPGGGGPGGGLDDDRLTVGGWGDTYLSLLEFDLSGLPQQATSARLELSTLPSQLGSPTQMHVDRITEFWDWRTQGTGSDRERLWWADRPSTVRYSPTPLPGAADNSTYSIDITGLYNDWQSGVYQNYGLQLSPVSTSNNFNQFYSSDYLTDPTKRPKLVVESEPLLNFDTVAVFGTLIGDDCSVGNIIGCIDPRDPTFDFRYDITGLQDIEIDIRVDLIGAPASQSLLDIWETSSEAAWSVFNISDGFVEIPIRLDLEFTDQNPHYTVTVHPGDGDVNASNWVTGNPSGHGYSRQGDVIAHEVGHLLGLYDEYQGATFLNPNWNPNIFTNSIMADLGDVHERHFDGILDFLRFQAGDPNLLLARAPVVPGYIPRVPIPEFGDSEPPLAATPVPIPESGLMLLGSFIVILCGSWRKSKKY